MSNVDAWKALREQAETALENGKYAEAERLFSSALKLAERLDNCPGCVYQSLKDIARFYEKRGESGIAGSLYQRALKVATIIGSPTHEVIELASKCPTTSAPQEKPGIWSCM